MFSPFQSSSSARSSDVDNLFVFDSLPLASSLVTDFDIGTSSSYALDAGSVAGAQGGAFNFSLSHHDLSSSSGSDPESGSDSPVHEEMSAYYGASSLFHPIGASLLGTASTPFTASASAMAGDSQTFTIDDVPTLVRPSLTPMHSLVPQLTMSAPVAPVTNTTTVPTKRRKKASSDTVSPTPVAYLTPGFTPAGGMTPSLLSSTSSSAMALTGAGAALALHHNNPFLATTTSSMGTASVSLTAAGANVASPSSASTRTNTKTASGVSSAAATTTKRRKTATKATSKKDKDTGSGDDDLPLTVTHHVLDLSSDVVSVPAQKLRKLKEDAELKRKRLDRKAELARNSRRKKKQRVVELEEQVAALQAQLGESHARTKDMEAHCHLLTMQTQSANAQIQAATQAANDAISQAQQTSQLQLSTQTQLEQVRAELTQAQQAADKQAAQQASVVAATGAQIVKPNDVSGLTAAVASLSTPDVNINETLNQLRILPTNTAGTAAVQSGVSSLMKAVDDVNTLTRSTTDLLEKLLTPCMPIRVLRWAMSQSDKFYADANGLWNMLLKQDCGVTAQQMVALDELRAKFKAAASKQHTSLSALYSSSTLGIQNGEPGSPTASPAGDTQQLLASLLQSHRSQVETNEDCFRCFANILSLDQMMKFLSWVERYGNVVVRINV